MTPTPSRHNHLRNLFLQNTGRLRIRAPKMTDNLAQITPAWPSWAGKVKRGKW